MAQTLCEHEKRLPSEEGETTLRAQSPPLGIPQSPFEVVRQHIDGGAPTSPPPNGSNIEDSATKEKMMDTIHRSQEEDAHGEGGVGCYRAPECPICFSFLADPLALPGCNHAFCRLCILSSTRFAPDGSRCPMCRATIDLKAITLDVPLSDSGLEAATLAAVGAEAYGARLARDRAKVSCLVAESSKCLPVFSMGRVRLGVGEQIGLHLFEPRYRILIRRAWGGNRLFVLANSPLPSAGEEGMVMGVMSTAIHGDGRADIRCRGVCRVSVADVHVEPGTGGLAVASVAGLPPRLADRLAAAAESIVSSLAPGVDPSSPTAEGTQRRGGGGCRRRRP